MRKLIALAGTTILAASVLTGCATGAGTSATADCTPAHSDLKTVNTGVLTASTSVFPPFSQVEGTKMTGVEGEILDKIAAMECLTVSTQLLDTASRISAAQTGRVDLAAGNVYCTAEREKVVTLAGPVYNDQIAIVSRTGAGSFAELEGKKVGTFSGSLWNEEFKKIYGGNLSEYPDPTAMYNDLAAGRIDGAADSLGSGTYVNKERGNTWTVKSPQADERVASSTQPGQVCFPMSKQNEALATAVKEDLEKLRSDGEIAEIFTKHGLDPAAAEVGQMRLIG